MYISEQSTDKQIRWS